MIPLFKVEIKYLGIYVPNLSIEWSEIKLYITLKLNSSLHSLGKIFNRWTGETTNVTIETYGTFPDNSFSKIGIQVRTACIIISLIIIAVKKYCY